MPLPRFSASHLVPIALILGLAACDERAPSAPPQGAAATELRVLGGDGQQATVGATLPEELVVVAVDAAGRPIPGTAIQFVVVAGGGQVAPQTVTADERGFARTRWTLGTVAVDSQVVEARLEGVAALRLRARVRPDAPVSFAVSGGGAAGQVGAALADSLSVTVKDRYGNPVGGVEVAWTVAAGGGAVSPARSATRLDGVAKAQWTLGLRVDSAQVTQVRVGNLDPVAFTANAVTTGVPLQLAKRGGDGQRGAAGSVLADSLGVVLRMQDGRPVQGAPVSWSVPEGAGVVTPIVSRTDANGAASTVWRLGTSAGLVQATATVDSGTLVFTSLIQAAAPATIVAAGGGGEGPVGGAMADSLAVRVTDAHGNPVPGAEIAWAAQGGGGSVQPATSRTDAQGIARAQWMLGLLAGSPGQTASATLDGLPPVAFHATATTRGVALHLARAGGDGQTGEMETSLADSLVVQLRTPGGEPVQGATVEWRVLSGGGLVSPASVRTDAQGYARTAWTMGTALGAAQASAQVDEGALAFSAVARTGAPAEIQRVGGDGQSATRGMALPDTLVVRVVDVRGNPVAGQSVHWSVQTGAGRVEHPVYVTDAQGLARTRWATGFAPGENTVTASVDGAAPARFRAMGMPGTLVLHGGGPVQKAKVPQLHLIDTVLSVYVSDAQGNQAIGAEINWEFFKGAAPTLLPSPAWSSVYTAHWYTTAVFTPYGWARFEDQEVAFYLPRSAQERIEWEGGGRYVAGDTALLYLALYSTTPPMVGALRQQIGTIFELRDDAGWVSELRTHDDAEDPYTVLWPLGTNTGTRTLYACIPDTLPGEEYCEEVSVQVSG